jgi:soluble lytic murein transglycosylase-like protein
MRGWFYLAAALLVLAAASSSPAQEIYIYEDENGTIHFSDMPRKGAATIIMGDDGKPLTARRLDQSVPFSETFNEAGFRYRLDPALLASVARVESDFNPRAVSRVGAKGVMQLMDETASDYGVSNVYDPAENIDAGARHLRDLLIAFDGDLRLALAAYNAGRTAVLRYGGVPPYDETQRYVKKIADIYGRVDGQISTRQIDNSYVAALAIGRRKLTIYRFTGPEGITYSITPPEAGRAEQVALRQ